MAKQRALEKWSPWIVLAAILILWEFICRAFHISDFIFPSPSAILLSLKQYAGPISGHALQSFWTTMSGFAIGVVVGVLLGFLDRKSTRLNSSHLVISYAVFCLK